MDDKNIAAALRKMKPHQARAWMLYFSAKRAGIRDTLKFIASLEGVTHPAIIKRLQAGKKIAAKSVK